jgi:hypothetical protein
VTSCADPGRRLLTLAGWASGRRVRVRRFVVGERLGPIGEILTIDPEMAVSRIYRERVEEYEEFLEVELVPVGDGARGHMAIMMLPAGSFYGGFDDCLAYFGDNVFEMVSKIQGSGGEVLR